MRSDDRRKTASDANAMATTLRELNVTDESIDSQMTITRTLMEEVTQKLSAAIKEKNMTNVGVATAMLETAEAKLKELHTIQQTQNKKRNQTIEKCEPTKQIKLTDCEYERTCFCTSSFCSYLNPRLCLVDNDRFTNRHNEILRLHS
jgi:hypothetical protein